MPQATLVDSNLATKTVLPLSAFFFQNLQIEHIVKRASNKNFNSEITAECQQLGVDTSNTH